MNSESKIKFSEKFTREHKTPVVGPILFLLSIVTVTGQSTRAVSRNSKTVIQIEAGWQFRDVGKTDWLNAIVPGCVHTDLLANKLIDDPFYRDNEKKQQWIEKKDWEYRTTFKVTAQTIAREHVELVFEGLDTYAQVFLNEQLLLNADNMFRTWRVDAKQALKRGDNTLRVVFCELLVNGKVVSSHDYFFAPFKELTFSRPTITSEVTQIRGGLSVKLKTDKSAKAVYLAVTDHDGFFSDNYFNLAPGRQVTVEFRSRAPLSPEQFRNRLQVRSVFDAF